jgi:N-acetylglucosaminyldiphosphoundecaprenol N-acetyl-beta-D-mannosaminyltransferase
MARVNILGVWVDDIGQDGLERAVVDCVEKGRKEVFAYANINTVNIAQRDPEFKESVGKASFVYCDGEGVRLGARILGTAMPQRTVLTRWIWDLAAVLQERGFSTFLLGGHRESIGVAAGRLLDRYPRLKLVGYHHGYFDRVGLENAEVVASIGRAQPNVLFVGFGMPDQELWINRNFDRLSVNAVIPCGGMIDYLSGGARVPPAWMSDNGLEWLHRLSQDPVRLWKRYLWGIPIFLYSIFLQRLRGERQV